MRQIIFSYKTPVSIKDVPAPALKTGFVLVRNLYSAVSIGTERISASYGQMNLLQKAIAKPKQVIQILNSIMNIGIKATMARVNNALKKWNPSGYSSAGIIVAVGPNVSEFRVGDRVACGGGGYAVHADLCIVPKRLVAKIPDSVTDEEAAFATIGAVAMHGFRVGDVNICERVAVVGLGIIGQFICQIAAAGGCEVIALDVKPTRVELAKSLANSRGVIVGTGAELQEVLRLTSGRGVDTVFICAATGSSEPTHLAAQIARDRGKIVVVGDVGMNLDRQIFYDKELEIRLSRSYGPGRYDRSYEEKGNDYPYSYVRWTEQRNMESFLELIGRENVKVTPLITHRFLISKADEAFKLLVNPGEEDPIGAVFIYDPLPEKETIQTITLKMDSGSSEGTPRVGFIGPGSFARNVLLPALMKQDVTPVAIAGTTGMSPTEAGKRYNFSYVTTEIGKILEDTTINTVFITTRHDSHAELVVKALRAGKNVYVEKPLATTVEELQEVCNAYNDCNGSVMVGFNRRFAPFSVKTKQFLPPSVPPIILVRVNAGPIDQRHWAMSEDEGGGRIVGEACHFIDLMQFIAGAPITSVYAQALRESPNLEQNLCATITFQNGAVGTLMYTAQGDTSHPKEYMEFYAGGKVAVINDFHELTLVENGKATTEKKRQDKGFEEEMKTYVAHLRDGKDCPIPFGQSVISTLATIALLDSCRSGKPIDIPKV